MSLIYTRKVGGMREEEDEGVFVVMGMHNMCLEYSNNTKKRQESSNALVTS